MRFRTLGILVGVALAAQAATAQSGNEPDAGFMHFVCLDSASRAVAPGEPVDPAASGDVWRRFRDLAPGLELSHCWSWNGNCPPQRLLQGEAPDWSCQAASDAASALRVRLLPPVESVPVGQSGTAAEQQGRLVTAAPAAMWEEVPVSYLPVYASASDSFDLPRRPETWRLRAWSEQHASEWQDVAAGTNSVSLALRPAATLSVQFDADGAPLEDARLWLVRPSWRGSRYPADLLGFEAANGDGLVEFVLPVPTSLPVIVMSDSRAGAAFGSVGEMPPVIELDAGLSVSGQAMNDAGDPIPGALIVGLSWLPGGFNLTQRHRAEAGPDGRFELTGLEAGSASLRIDGADLRFARTLDLEESVDLGPVVLSSPENLWVQVVARGSGMPVPAARVQVGGGEWLNVDHQGLVRVSPLLGRNFIVAAEGYLTARSVLPAAVGLTVEQPYALLLDPAFTVKGTYVAADGYTPAAGGRLAVINRAGNRSSFGAVAPDGAFSIDLEPGAYRLVLSAGNAGVRRLDVSGSASEVRDLGVVTALPSAWVTGTLVSGEDYAPVGDAAVSYTRPSELGPLMAAATGNVDTVTTNADGYFELHGLELGSSTLRVEANGFAARDVEVHAAAVEWVNAGTIELHRGRRITVRSNAREGFVRLDSGGIERPGEQIAERLSGGEAILDAVPDGPFLVRVYDGGAVVCEVDDDSLTGDRTVRCDRSVVNVAGLVTIGDRPADGMLLWKQRRRQQFPEGAITSIGRSLPQTTIVTGQAHEMDTMLDSEGRYRLEDVLPGVWEVIWAPLAGGTQEVREVRVPRGPAGGEAVLNLHYGGVSITGVVVMSDGQPASRASVEVFPGGRTVGADEAGRFRVMGLKPGEYQLRARMVGPPALQSDLALVELRDHGDREMVQLMLQDGTANDELVIDLRGSGTGLCFVETGGSVAQVVQIEAGRAAVKLSPPLAESVRIACHADGRYVLSDWRDLRSALEAGVDFDPYESDSSLALTGETSLVPVRIVGPGGWDLGALRIWLGGAESFRAGERVTGLPAGSYTLRWGDRPRSVWVESGQLTEVEIDR